MITRAHIIPALKYTLAGFGAFLWVMLWYERHPLLGLAQLVIIGDGLWRECGPRRS